ncbi:unnamed protein product [Urochloa humidicola]
MEIPAEKGDGEGRWIHTGVSGGVYFIRTHLKSQAAGDEHDEDDERGSGIGSKGGSSHILKQLKTILLKLKQNKKGAGPLPLTAGEDAGDEERGAGSG